MINKMKNWLKIWVVALAICATAATLVSTWNVKADNRDNKVEVVIGQYNSGQNTCTWTDYLFNFTASTEQQSGTQVWTISCKFWNSSWQAVTLALDWDLELSTDNTVTIPSSNVSLTNGSWTSTPSSIAWTDPAAVSETEFTSAKTLYNKKDNAIGDAKSEDITIKVIVDAWQPDGTYDGTLVLSYGG